MPTAYCYLCLMATLLNCCSVQACGDQTVRCCCCSAADIFLHWHNGKMEKSLFHVGDILYRWRHWKWSERCDVAGVTITDDCRLFLLRAAGQNEKQGTRWICRWGAAACRLCGCSILLTWAKRFCYAHALLRQALVCKSLVTEVKQKRSNASSLISGEWCAGS